MVKLRDIWQKLYPYGVFRTGTDIYLTFDDGPIPEVTPQVLAILARYDIKATFFMVGENIDKHPDVFAQVLQAGHSIGNHTYNHLKGWNTDFDTYMANVHQWEDAAKNHLSPLFRPPYGKATLAQRRALHQLGYQIIYWDILTQDYNASVTPEHMGAPRFHHQFPRLPQVQRAHAHRPSASHRVAYATGLHFRRIGALNAS